jgi:hypothetical protein
VCRFIVVEEENERQEKWVCRVVVRRRGRGGDVTRTRWRKEKAGKRRGRGGGASSEGWHVVKEKFTVPIVILVKRISNPSLASRWMNKRQERAKKAWLDERSDA